MDGEKKGGTLKHIWINHSLNKVRTYLHSINTTHSKSITLIPLNISLFSNKCFQLFFIILDLFFLQKFTNLKEKRANTDYMDKTRIYSAANTYRILDTVCKFCLKYYAVNKNICHMHYTAVSNFHTVKWPCIILVSFHTLSQST